MDAAWKRAGTARKSFLRILLFLTIVIPALAFGRGTIAGRLDYALYREPKLFAIGVLGALFMAAFLWLGPRQAWTLERLAAVCRRPAVVALTAFLGYMSITGIWVRVAQNHLHQLHQYGFLFALLVVLLAWSEHEDGIPELVRNALVVAMAAVTLVGLAQYFQPLPWLPPIDPELGTEHPSFMGYKNPAALAVLGQIFLLAGTAVSTSSRRLRLGLGVLLLLELAYLASLESRTALMALAAGGIFVLGLYLIRWPRHIWRVLAAAMVAVLVVTAVLVLRPAVRERAASALGFIAHPASYLESDRGTYLRNTVHMARHRPFGVGWGDWQTHYPLYRLHDRARSFTLQHQVRRAHSDHVQFLGEGGWPGLVLWLAFLGLAVAGPARAFWRTGRPAPLWVSAQLVALAAAMVSDYVLDLPFHKMQFFLVVFLALVPGSRGPLTEAAHHVQAAPQASRWGKGLLSSAFVALAVVSGATFYKAYHAARIEGLYLEARKSEDPVAKTALLEAVMVHGKALGGVGHTKTLHRSWLLVADSARLLRRRDTARRAALRALQLHPFYPNALTFMTHVAKDWEEQEHWRRAYEFVMADATEGFEGSYPNLTP